MVYGSSAIWPAASDSIDHGGLEVPAGLLARHRSSSAGDFPYLVLASNHDDHRLPFGCSRPRTPSPAGLRPCLAGAGRLSLASLRPRAMVSTRASGCRPWSPSSLRVKGTVTATCFHRRGRGTDPWLPRVLCGFVASAPGRPRPGFLLQHVAVRPLGEALAWKVGILQEDVPG